MDLVLCARCRVHVQADAPCPFCTSRGRGRIIATWFAGFAVMVALMLAFGGEFEDNFRLPGAEAQAGIERLHAFPRGFARV